MRRLAILNGKKIICACASVSIGVGVKHSHYSRRSAPRSFAVWLGHHIDAWLLELSCPISGRARIKTSVNLRLNPFEDLLTFDPFAEASLLLNTRWFVELIIEHSSHA